MPNQARHVSPPEGLGAHGITVLRAARCLGPWSVFVIVAAAGAQLLVNGASLVQGLLLAASSAGVVLLALWVVGLLREHAASLGADARHPELTVDSIPVPAFIVDLDRAVVVVANAEAHLLLGYEIGDLNGRSLLELSPEWERSRSEASLARAARDGHGELRDRPRQRRDGSIIWVDAVIRRLDYRSGPHALIAWYDTTDRRASENELVRRLGELQASHQSLSQEVARLHSLNERHQALFEHAGDALLVLDAADATVLEANRLALRLLSAATVGLAREHLRALLADGEGELATAIATLRQSQGPVVMPISLSRLDGSSGPIIMHGSHASVGGSDLLYLCLREADTREPLDEALRRSHEELQRQTAETARMNAQLLRSNAVKSQFMANMSHEIRTPLNAINGFAELLADDSFGALSESQRGFVDRISDSGQHLLQLINDIIDLSKVEAGKVELDLEPVRVNKLVEQAAKIMRGTARNQGISIRVTVDEDDPVAMADERRVKQVLFNLLSNAVKYSPEGSAVSVAVESDQEWITVRVADQGVGIAAPDHERIFEEFVRVGPRGAHPSGAGLGLPLSRQLINLHGGQLTVSSAMGEGSTFRFTLPVAQNHTLPEQPDSITDIRAGRYLKGS